MNDLLTHVFVDGPNVDMVLGKDILGRRPLATQRPKWDRVLSQLATTLGPLKPTFVLNGNQFAHGGPELFGFYRAIRHCGYRVECPCGTEGDPVDAYIQKSVRTLARMQRPCSVALLSHDHGYAQDLNAVLMLGGQVTVVGFPEEMAPELLRLVDQGARVIDLEREAYAFNVKLPRPHLAY